MKTAVQKISGFFLSLDKVSKFIILVGLFISFYSFFFFMSNKIYLIGSDAFYYISIADSIVKYSEMEDITTIPSFPIKTPQNGIVFLHVILSLLGISAKGRILTIVVINYLLYLSGVYPLYKIAGWIGLRKGLSLAALLSVYMGAWHIYRINLLAINDGIFNSLTLWLVYMVIKFIRDMDVLESFSLSKDILKKLLIIFLLLVVSIQFRLNSAMVIGSAVISTLLVKKFKASVLLMAGCLFLLLSFVSIYAFVQVTRLESSGLIRLYNMFLVISNMDSIKFQLWGILPRLVAGLSGLTNPLATLLFTIFPLSMMFIGVRGILEKDFGKVFIACVCLTGLWFTMNFQNARVIFYTFPFIYLILFTYKKTRIVGYTFVVLVFFLSLQQFYSGFVRGQQSKFWLYVYDQNISLPDNALLSSYNRRHPYFFLRTRNYLGDENWEEISKKIAAPGKFIPEITWALIDDHGSLYVMGDSAYIDSSFSQLSELAKSNGYMIDRNTLTPELNESEGWGLIQFTLK